MKDSKPLRTSPASVPSGAPAFTLVEMLAVVTIISLLVAILVPSVYRGREMVKRSQSMMTIRMLSDACTMYWEESGDYPEGAGPADRARSYPPSSGAPATWGGGPWEGKHILVEALTGYLDKTADNAEGNGFRVQVPGKLYGPYNGTDSFRTSTKAKNQNDPPEKNRYFVDSFDNPILYYRFDGTKYNDDNPTDFTGDINAYAKNAAGQFFRTDFMIISIGRDKVWSSPGQNKSTDDETNFQQE